MGTLSVGIDVGGTNLKAGLIDTAGRILSVERVPLNFQSPEAFAETLADLAKTVMGNAVDVEYVGIGLPGAVSGRDVLYTTNIPMQNVPLESLFRKHLDLPVYLGNDADCAAVGEYFCGAGWGTRDFAVITLGTGIGGGVILNGKLRGGVSSSEAGHSVIVYGGAQCPCGRRGCWEQYASATALIRLTREAMSLYPGSLLHIIAEENGTVDGQTPFQAAMRGDAAAKEVCSRYVSYLAAGAVNFINTVRPEALAVGGGVAAAPEELLLNPLRELVAQESFFRHGGQITEIFRAKLGNDAGMIGAAFLGRAL